VNAAVLAGALSRRVLVLKAKAQSCRILWQWHYWRLMKRTHTRVLTDDELRPQLEARDTISFVGRPVTFQEIERQVERLGFGDLYIVSTTQKPPSDVAKISLKPEAR
jgi:hypothetical protein